MALATSLGLHVLLLLLGGIPSWMPRLPRHTAPPPTTLPDTIAMVVTAPPLVSRPAAPARPSDVPQPVKRQVDEPVTVVPPEPPRVVPMPPPPADTGGAPGVPAPAPSAAVGRIRPDLGQGKLWVRPLPLPPKELARRLSKGHATLVDSAVTAIVQKFLDSIANDPSTRGTAMPDWTTSIAGKKFGVDQNSVYIAGLKIPAAVLALLPIPAGNIDQNQAYSHLLEIQADIQQAAQRADNLAEFKERIREIRIRKARDEEFERNRRQQPAAPAPAPRDSVGGIVRH